MLAKIDNDYRNGESIHWGIINLRDNKIAGTCGYYRGFANNTGELGCVLLPHYTGRGIMTEAMKLAIDFGFETMKLQKIIAITHRTNTKAIQLLKRLEFKAVESPNQDDLHFEYCK